MSLSAYLVAVALVGLERLAELVVARRNAAWARARGAVEAGAGHYPVMVALHTGLLAGCAAEAWWRRAPPPAPWPAGLLGVVVATQALRWWCIRSLGRRWNTRVLVLPGRARVAAGPYRWLAHPNYVAVVIEGAALPLAYGCWLTAALFALGNFPLLATRIRCEDRALTRAAAAPEPARS